MKFIEKISKILILFMFIIEISGCVEWTEKTTIYADGKCSELITIETNAIFAEGLRADTKKKEFESLGYTLEIKNEDDKVLLFLSRSFNSVKEMYNAKKLYPESGIEESSSGVKAHGELKIKDYFFVKTFMFVEKKPPIEPIKGKINDPERKNLEEMREKIGANMYTYKRIIEMPGVIISSNAKNIEKKNKAIWDVSFENIQKGVTFEVTSRIINIHSIIAVSVLFLLIVTILILILRKKKRA